MNAIGVMVEQKKIKHDMINKGKNIGNRKSSIHFIIYEQFRSDFNSTTIQPTKRGIFW